MAVDWGAMAALLILMVRWFIAGVFLRAGVVKLGDQAEFRAAVANYQLLPLRFVGPVAVVLPVAEIAGGVLLAAGILTAPAAILLGLLLAAFAVAIGINLARGLASTAAAQDRRRQARSAGATWQSISRWPPARPPWPCSARRRVGLARTAKARSLDCPGGQHHAHRHRHPHCADSHARGPDGRLPPGPADRGIGSDKSIDNLRELTDASWMGDRHRGHRGGRTRANRSHAWRTEAGHAAASQ